MTRIARHSGLVLLALALVSVPVQAAEALDQHGEPQAWRGEAGHVTVVDFAASWCVPCWEALPRLQALAAEHPEVRVIVVSVDLDRDGRDQLVRQLDLTMPVLWDEDHAIAEHYQPKAMPSTYLVGPDGTVFDSLVGSAEEQWPAFVAQVEVATARITSTSPAPAEP